MRAGLNQSPYKIGQRWAEFEIDASRLSVLINRGGKYKAIAVARRRSCASPGQSRSISGSTPLRRRESGRAVCVHNGRDISSPELLAAYSFANPLVELLYISPAVAVRGTAAASGVPITIQWPLPARLWYFEQYAHHRFDSAVRDLATARGRTFSAGSYANRRGSWRRFPGHRFGCGEP